MILCRRTLLYLTHMLKSWNLDFWFRNCSENIPPPSILFSVLSKVYLGHPAPLVLALEHQNDNVQCQSCTYSRRLYSKEKYKWKIQSTVGQFELYKYLNRPLVCLIVHNRVGTSQTHANICDTYMHDCVYEMKTPCILRREANR